MDLTLTGQRIRRARAEAGLTIAQLAERTGYSKSTIARIEIGKAPFVKLEQIAAIAEVLGRKVESFVRAGR